MAATPIVQPPIAYVKEVRRNRATRDWDAYVTISATGERIHLGSRNRSWDAERLCDDYVHAQLTHQPITLDNAIVTFEVDREAAPAGALAIIDTPTYNAYGDSDGSVLLTIGEGEIALQPDDLVELERIVMAGILRRLVDLARTRVAA